MATSWIIAMKQLGRELVHRAQVWIKTNTTPTNSSQVLGTVADLFRSKDELVVENALLRQQMIILKRSVKQPKLTRRDRWLMVLLASKLDHWKQAVLVVQPATLLR